MIEELNKMLSQIADLRRELIELKKRVGALERANDPDSPKPQGYMQRPDGSYACPVDP